MYDVCHGISYIDFDAQGVDEASPPNYNQAFQWYEQAAMAGYSQAQNNIGIMYKRGQGVEQSDEKAREWYEMAAKQGHAVAQYNLGNMIYGGQGRGTAPNDAEAMAWLSKAHAQGIEEAKESMDQILRDQALREMNEEASYASHSPPTPEARKISSFGSKKASLPTSSSTSFRSLFGM